MTTAYQVLYMAILLLFLKMSKIIAFDTSNYTTSAAVFDTVKGVLWENRIMLPVTSGKCGLRQSEAVFSHIKNLKVLLNDMPQFSYDYVAASVCPSERVDSYMPCFLVGNSFASSLSQILNLPLLTCSHQKNHIGAAVYSGDCTHVLKSDFFAYHVSGGTTDILLCRPKENRLEIKRIGGSADISCGQLTDRAGVALGFEFPCGKHIEKHSSGKLSGNIKLHSNDFEYNFSGFQNKIQDMILDGRDKSDVCDYVLDVVYSYLVASIDNIRTAYKPLPVVLCGGVMSNSYIRDCLSKNVDNVYFSENKYSLDNALGTAFICAYERGLINV